MQPNDQPTITAPPDQLQILLHPNPAELPIAGEPKPGGGGANDPWTIELVPWQFWSQTADPARDGDGGSGPNAANDCGPECDSMATWHLTGVTIDADYILDCVNGPSHRGYTSLADRVTWAQKFCSTPATILTPQSKEEWLWQLWKALSWGHPVTGLFSFSAPGAPDGHFRSVVGMSSGVAPSSAGTPGTPPAKPAWVSGLVRDARYHAWKAGFRGAGQTTVVAIAMAESGLDPAAINTNTDGSVDRGILQINSRWHPEVTDACAFDPACAFRAAFAISHQGADFSPWSTYQSGAYRAHLAAAAGQQASPNLLVTADPATGARRVESWDLAWSWAKGPIVHLHRKRSILT